MSEALTTIERNNLQKLTIPQKDIFKYVERRISEGGRGKATNHLGVTRALVEIRDRRLHREVSSNFYDYCLMCFGLLPERVDWYMRLAQNNNAEPIVYKAKPDKIGFTKNVKQRLSSLATMSPLSIELVGCVTGDLSDEKTLHRRFAKHRSHGEWFVCDDEIVEYAKEHTNHVN